MNRAAHISNLSPNGISDHDLLDNRPQNGESLSANDAFADKVAHAQSQLEQLQQRQQQIEGEKSALETLWKKQSDFQSGRAEIIHDFQQALEVIERNNLQAEQRMECYTRIRECFSHHLSIISSLRSEEWDREQLEVELDGASITIEEGRCEYDRALDNLNRLNSGVEELPGTSQSSDTVNHTSNHRNFTYWLRSGFAFSLPIMIFGAISFAILIYIN